MNKNVSYGINTPDEIIMVQFGETFLGVQSGFLLQLSTYYPNTVIHARCSKYGLLVKRRMLILVTKRLAILNIDGLKMNSALPFMLSVIKSLKTFVFSFSSLTTTRVG